LTRDFERSLNWSLITKASDTPTDPSPTNKQTITLNLSTAPIFLYRDEEKAIVSRLLKCSDMDGSPKVRLNAVWKIILREFRDYVC